MIIAQGIEEYSKKQENTVPQGKELSIQRVEGKLGFITFVDEKGNLTRIDFGKTDIVEVKVKQEILEEQSKKDLDKVLEGFGAAKTNDLNPNVKTIDLTEEQLDKYKNFKSELKRLFVDKTEDYLPKDEPKILESHEC